MTPDPPAGHHLIALTPGLTDWLEPLMAVVVAQFVDDGRLLHGNQGFLRFMKAATSENTASLDVRHFFLNPSLHDLLAVQAPIGEPVYQGIFNVTDAQGVCRSLVGAVHRFDATLMLVAEYDVAEMEQLNAQVIELNQELAEVQRTLARANRRLQADEERLRQLASTDPLTGLATGAA